MGESQLSSPTASGQRIFPGMSMYWDMMGRDGSGPGMAVTIWVKKKQKNTHHRAVYN